MRLLELPDCYDNPGSFLLLWR